MDEDVLKFGGSSVSSAKNINTVADIIIGHYLSSPSGLNVVVSAVGTPPGEDSKKVTNRALELADLILAGGTYEDARQQIGEIGRVHLDIAIGLHLNSFIYYDQIKKLGLVAQDAINRLARNEKVYPDQLRDALTEVGEMSSTPIVAAVVQAQLEKKRESLEAKLKSHPLRQEERAILNRLAGGNHIHVVAEPGDAGFVTDSNFTKARLLDESIDTEIARHHQSLRARNEGKIIFYPGFIAKDKDGNRTTLGRDGSNITATALGAAINAGKITLYSDTDGVLLVSPKIVKDSQTARFLSHKEVVMLAQYGGMKVLEDVSLGPLFRKNRSIPIYVTNTFNPDDPGTLITHRSDNSRSIMKGIGVIPNVQYREFGVRDFADYQKLETALRTYPGLRILKSSLETTNGAPIGKFVLAADPSMEKENGKEFYRKALSDAVKASLGEKVSQGFNYSIASLITIVGKGLGNSSRDMSRIYSILERADWGGISDQRYKLPIWLTGDSIHVCARSSSADGIVNAVYNQLKRVNVVLYGSGKVGSAFLKKAIKGYDELGITVVSVVDSSGAYGKIGGFTVKDLEAIIAVKKGSMDFKQAVGNRQLEGGMYLSPEEAKNFKNLRDFGKGDVVLVDATPEELMIHRYVHALHLGARVISVNKAPYAAGRESANAQREIPKLFEALLENRLFNRGTVGANIGIPGTLLDILAKNPEYVTVQGCMSGTLGNTSTFIEHGNFSDGVQDSIRKGLTEPVPFKDYSGKDVLNKMLILWRTIAAKYGLDPFKVDVKHESYLDQAIRKYEATTGQSFETSGLSRLTKQSFVERMRLLDDSFRELQNELSNGYIFRYVGEINYDEQSKLYSISVGMRQVQKESPLGTLKGKENRVMFGINRPSSDPQEVVSGHGAGFEETANAIMNDLKQIVGLARGEYVGRKISYERWHEQKPSSTTPSIRTIRWIHSLQAWK